MSTFDNDNKAIAVSASRFDLCKSNFFCRQKTLTGFFDMGIMLDGKILIHEVKSLAHEFANYEEYMLIFNFGIFV